MNELRTKSNSEYGRVGIFRHIWSDQLRESQDRDAVGDVALRGRYGLSGDQVREKFKLQRYFSRCTHIFRPVESRARTHASSLAHLLPLPRSDRRRTLIVGGPESNSRLSTRSRFLTRAVCLRQCYSSEFDYIKPLSTFGNESVCLCASALARFVVVDRLLTPLSFRQLFFRVRGCQL